MKRTNHLRVLTAAVTAATLLLAGCGAGVPDAQGTGSGSPTPSASVAASRTSTPPQLTAAPDQVECDNDDDCYCPASEVAETDRIASALPWNPPETFRNPEGCAVSFSIKGSRAKVTDNLPRALQAAGYGTGIVVTSDSFESRGYGADIDGRWLSLLVRDSEGVPGTVLLTILLYEPPPRELTD